MTQIDIDSEKYPNRLRQIKDPPKMLYYKGNWDSDIFSETLGVVGSRKMTSYGEFITNKLIRDISGKGITIVSGFMYGIDAQAHIAALSSAGRTIAVMPCGIDLVHPSYQIDLYNSIIENRGLIISEYPDSTPPALWTYPRRNRIVAGISQTLLVVEAGIKSGALITSNIAKTYNKKIYAVPGPLTSSVSMGTAILIRNGASIVTDSTDILSYYGKTGNDELFSKKTLYGLTKSQKKILKILSEGPLEIDQITRQSGISVSDTGSELTLLVLHNLVNIRGRKYYIL